jgi:hypothetical protein
MNAKCLWLGGLVAAVLGLGEVRAQGPSSSYPGMNGPSTADATPGPTDPTASTVPPPAVTPGLSNWILHPNIPGCCGPIGRNGSIGSELFLRSGLAFPIGGGFLNNVLDVGWEVEGGVRSLFFNPEEDAAWTVQISLSNINNNVTDKARKVTLLNLTIPGQNGQADTHIPSVDVSAKEYNRTSFNLAGGREWYLSGPANGDNACLFWRAGFDVGGGWGTAKLDLNELRHRTDTVGSVFVAAHTDLEVPCGGCIFQFGARTEWRYTWSDILEHQNEADVTDISLLFTAGIRY